MTGPYGSRALDYFAAGWRGILPLPLGEKAPPPNGYTGWGGRLPSYADIYAWVEDRGGSNIGCRAPLNVIGLDVDAHDGKSGAATFADACDRWGMPPSTVMSSARGDGVSGIRWYRVPEGLAWPGELGPGVEIIQWGHRYAVVPPSLHPNGGTYRWYGTEDDVPRVDDLPELPAAWVEGLTGGRLASPSAKAAVTGADLRAWADAHGGSPCPRILSALAVIGDRLVASGGSRHDAGLRGLMYVVRLSAEGHQGAWMAVTNLRALWLSVVTPDRGTAAEGEWDRMLTGALATVAADAWPDDLPDPCSWPLSGIIPRPRPPALRAHADESAPQWLEPTPEEISARRRIVLTNAAQIKTKIPHWLYEERLAIGTLALLAGREGLGKSTLAYWIVARLTRGRLKGIYAHHPKDVLICATEDSWAHIIVPRLMAADANLNRIFRVEMYEDDTLIGLSLPVDLIKVEDAAKDKDVALLLLDPLMSRLDTKLDTHRDGDVRRALEPMAAMAERTGMAILGLIHHTKAATTDPLTAVMGSKAFAAVARSVHTVVSDSEDEEHRKRLFGTVKNNMGRSDLPLEAFAIVGQGVTTDEGPTTVGRVEWLETREGTIADHLAPSEVTSERRECADWLRDYLSDQGGEAERSSIVKASRAAGFSDTVLRRARESLRVKIINVKGVYPRRTVWQLAVVLARAREQHTDTTNIYAGHGAALPNLVGSVTSVVPVLARVSTTEDVDHEGT